MQHCRNVASREGHKRNISDRVGAANRRRNLELMARKLRAEFGIGGARGPPRFGKKRSSSRPSALAYTPETINAAAPRCILYALDIRFMQISQPRAPLYGVIGEFTHVAPLRIAAARRGAAASKTRKLATRVTVIVVTRYVDTRFAKHYFRSVFT